MGSFKEFSLSPAQGPSAMVLGPDGKIYGTTEIGVNCYIYSVTTAGSVTLFGPLPTSSAGPGGLCFDNNGLAWFTENHTDKIGSLNPSNSTITEYNWNASNVGLGGVAKQSNGLMLVCEAVTNKLCNWDPSAHTVGTKVSIASLPHDPLLFQDGNVWGVANTGQTLWSCDTSGNVTTQHTFTASSNPYALCQDNTGVVWVTLSGKNAIARFDPSSVLPYAEFTVPEASSTLNGICYDPLTNFVWFICRANAVNKVRYITKTGIMGGPGFVIPTPNSASSKFIPGSDKRLWGAETSGNNVFAFTTSQTYGFIGSGNTQSSGQSAGTIGYVSS